MKPAPFEYHAPDTLEEATALLAGLEDAKALAGGQSLIPMMNFRLARPRHLVDLRRVPGLGDVREEDGRLAIGAMSRQAAVEADGTVRRRCPLLPEALAHVGHHAIRTRGTIGGSLSHADPSAELPLVVTALDGELVLAGPHGRRTVAARDFFLAPLTPALEPGEILTEVRLPVLGAGTGTAFVELSRRHGDFAIVAACAVLELGPDGVCRRAALALGGVAPTPVRASGAERILTGRAPSDAVIRAAAAVVREDIAPDSDLHASAEYRAAMAAVYAETALAQAWRRLGRV